MAKLRIFSARDSKIKLFLPPFFNLHLGQALRMWEDAVNQEGTQVNKFPTDFCLYEIGTYDEDTGIFENHPQHVMVASALDVLKKPKPLANPLPMDLNKQA